MIEYISQQAERDLKQYDTYQILANEMSETTKLTSIRAEEMAEKFESTRSIVMMLNKQVNDYMSPVN